MKMNGKYRIIKKTYFYGSIMFLAQKRFLGFFWWYDWLDDGYWSDGYFETYEEAKEAIERDKYKIKEEVIYIE